MPVVDDAFVAIRLPWRWAERYGTHRRRERPRPGIRCREALGNERPGGEGTGQSYCRRIRPTMDSPVCKTTGDENHRLRKPLKVATDST